MFEWNEDEERWDAMHHPFTAPTGDLDADPGTWRSRAYDVVFDGWELGGGSIRISDPDVQQKVFDALGIGPEEAEERFGFLLEALTLRRAAARRHRLRDRPHRGAAGRRELDPRRDRLPEGGQRSRPADRRAGAGGRAPAAGARRARSSRQRAAGRVRRDPR